MTSEEWDALSDDDRPGIRYCMVVTDPGEKIYLAPNAEIHRCTWCNVPIWVDPSQEFPAEAREAGVISVCERCVLMHPDLGSAMLKGFPEAYQHWCETGVSKAIKIEE